MDVGELFSTEVNGGSMFGGINSVRASHDLPRSWLAIFASVL